MTTVESMIKKYGREISLNLPDGWKSMPYNAFIQPLRYKNKMYLKGEQTDIGIFNPDMYLYIGPPQFDICELPQGAWIEDFYEVKYRIVKSEKVFISDEIVYIWGVIEAMEDENYD